MRSHGHPITTSARSTIVGSFTSSNGDDAVDSPVFTKGREKGEQRRANRQKDRRRSDARDHEWED